MATESGGARDHPERQMAAAALVGALRERYAHPDDVELVAVPELAHPPGVSGIAAVCPRS